MPHAVDLDRTRDRSTYAAADDTATVAEPGLADVWRELPAAGVGTTVGRYVVLEELGRGGMGRVLRGYDPKLQREVAVKQLRREALEHDATARLVAEARAMAKLSHPNVVAVYDVETLASREVVLVMEYVRGPTLRRWLTAAPRDWQAVVGLLVQAGRGLAAAHAAELLHRDFKPGNVLVSEDGTPKVTDFGIAKLAGTAPWSQSIAPEHDELGASQPTLTLAGTVMGTPRYMAPEQHRGEALTPAVDQYAFCVTLWEALCGAPPFAGDAIAKDKQKGPPAWPKAGIPRTVVEAIVRGLSPAPGDRWPTMAALLEVLARDPSRRRNRWLVAAGTAGAIGLVGAAWWAAADARAERCTGARAQLAGIWDDGRRSEVEAAILGVGDAYATRAWERAARELDAYAEEWTAVHTEACEATTVRGEQSAAVMDLRMACLHRAAMDLGAVTSQLASADAQVVQNVHRLTAGLRPLSRCSDAEALSRDVEPPLPEEAAAVERIHAAVAEAKAARIAGRYAEAKAAVEAAGAALAEVQYGPVRTEVRLEEGEVLNRLGQYAAAEAAMSEVIELASRWRQPAELQRAASQLVFLVGSQQGKPEEGLRYAALAKGLAQGDVRLEADLTSNLAAILAQQGRYEEAEAENRRALALWEQSVGLEHPNAAQSRTNLAIVLQELGRYEEAEVEHRRALATWERELGVDHPRVAGSRNNLATVLQALGRYAEAETELHRALASLEATLGPEHPHIPAIRTNLAGVMSHLGRPADAEAEHRRALALFEKALGPEHPDVGSARHNLATVLQAEGKHEEAELEYRRALALFEKTLSPGHPTIATAHGNLGRLLQLRGRPEEAEAELRLALALREEHLGADHPDVAYSQLGLAELLLERERAAEALPLAEPAFQRSARDDVPPEQRARAAFVLARASWATEDDAKARTRARGLAEQALAAYEQAEGTHDEEIREVRAWLERHRTP